TQGFGDFLSCQPIHRTKPDDGFLLPSKLGPELESCGAQLLTDRLRLRLVTVNALLIAGFAGRAQWNRLRWFHWQRSSMGPENRLEFGSDLGHRRDLEAQRDCNPDIIPPPDDPAINSLHLVRLIFDQLGRPSVNGLLLNIVLPP